jgi:hypothetical protein
MHYNQGDRVRIVATRAQCAFVGISNFPTCFSAYDNYSYNSVLDQVICTGFYKSPSAARSRNWCVTNFEEDEQDVGGYLPDGRRARTWFLPDDCFHPYAVTPQQKAFLNFRQAMLAKGRHATA